jgi:superfamily II DNA/RNA helicase
MTATKEAAPAATFDDLGIDSDLVDILVSAGITEPFPVQTMTIPDALAGRDVCGAAQTGSGKTLAFGLPLVQSTERDPDGRPGALVLVPTRELCSQVAAELTPLATAQGLGLVSVYGGAKMGSQIDQIKRGAEVVVATPGRLIDLVERRHIDLTRVSRVVIDEADQMADMGFLPQVHQVMRLIGDTDQTMLFSATLDGQVGSLVKRYLADPVRHEANPPDEVVDTQEHRFIAVHHMDKAKVAAAISRSCYRTLVFVRTKRGADRVAKQLREEGVDARAIHGDLRQRDRERTLASFVKGDLPVLVATDLASRGLHIDERRTTTRPSCIAPDGPPATARRDWS